MKEIEGNLWDTPNMQGKLALAMLCITTNGYVNQKGQCVMGRGCAKEAADRYPGLAIRLGDMIKAHGNQVFFFQDIGILTFPVKHVWNQQADINLIVQSAQSLKMFADTHPNTFIILPRPGCGNGGLRWADVQPYLEFLPDNVHIISFPGEQ